VYVSFIVDPTGKVLNAKVERGIGMDCDAEALRVVNMMPDWSPGRQGGRYVPVKYILPIAFVLE
jgi:protein TonB